MTLKPNDDKATSGVVVKINNSTVSWLSRKQSIVSTSTAEAFELAYGRPLAKIINLYKK